MQFGWMNLTGFLIIALMMIPNIIYALRNPHPENKCTSKPMLVLEQIGRYGSMALMVFPLLVWEFGFTSLWMFFVWTGPCMAMLLGYFICWGLYFRKPSLKIALWLAILPSGIFVLRGFFLRHWLLTAFDKGRRFRYHQLHPSMKGDLTMEKFAPFEKLPKKKQRELNWAKRGSWYGINLVTASQRTQKRTTDERHRNGVMAPILCLLLFLRRRDDYSASVLSAIKTSLMNPVNRKLFSLFTAAQILSCISCR